MAFKDPAKEREYKRKWQKEHQDHYTEYMREWRKANPEKTALYAQRRAQKRRDHPELTRRQDSRWRNSPQYMREWRMKRRYNLTNEDWDAMFTSQNCACAICLQPLTQETAHTDHDHDTGMVRAILCRDCNLVLGHAKDDPTRLRLAATYIENHRKEAPTE